MQSVQITPAEFRKVLSTFATGVTVVTTQVQGKVHGMTANAFTSVSLNPPLVLVSVTKDAETHQYIQETGKFGISILSAEQSDLSNYYAGKADPEIEATLVYDYMNDIPVLRTCISSLVCNLWAQYDGGDHTLFVGEVIGQKMLQGNPLIFFQSKYRGLTD
jgi:flavin reductase